MTDRSGTEAFRYTAATGTGELVQGIVHAGSARDAAESLRQQTLIPVAIESVTRQASASRPRPSRAGRREGLTNAIRTVATLLSAGVTLERALDFAARHASQPDVSAALGTIHRDVQQGGMLSAALRNQPLFGAFAGAVTHAGEESGTLHQALERLAAWYEREQDLRSQLRSALLYPALMGIVAGIGVAVLLSVVVPRFVSILGDVGGELPLSTRILVGASQVVIGGWFIWVPLVLALVFGIRWWSEQPGNRRRWHAARLAIPVVGKLERDLSTARFSGALGVLLNSGTPMLASVRVARESVTNDALARELETASEKIARGERVATSLSTALSPIAVELLAAGEEGGRLPEMCERVAAVHEESTERSLRTLVRLVEPALILVFGAIVGFIALAMLQAVYSVNSGIV